MYFIIVACHAMEKLVCWLAAIVCVVDIRSQPASLSLDFIFFVSTFFLCTIALPKCLDYGMARVNTQPLQNS